MRAIIIAAGEATRWGNYLGVPKHLIPIDGEPIAKRTIRLLKDRGVSDIFLVGLDSDLYRLTGSKFYLAKKNPEYAGADKFLSSKELWDT
jgi:choline kinase